MKRQILLFYLILPCILSAQGPLLVAAGNYSNDFYQWTYSVGDLAINTFETNQGKWTQGTQQPTDIILSVNPHQFDRANVTLYPMPTRDILNGKLSLPTDHVLLLTRLYDAKGFMIANQFPLIFSNEDFALKVSALTPGQYFLEFSDSLGNSVFKSFQKF